MPNRPPRRKEADAEIVWCDTPGPRYVSVDGNAAASCVECSEWHDDTCTDKDIAERAIAQAYPHNRGYPYSRRSFTRGVCEKHNDWRKNAAQAENYAQAFMANCTEHGGVVERKPSLPTKTQRWGETVVGGDLACCSNATVGGGDGTHSACTPQIPLVSMRSIPVDIGVWGAHAGTPSATCLTVGKVCTAGDITGILNTLNVTHSQRPVMVHPGVRIDAPTRTKLMQRADTAHRVKHVVSKGLPSP